MNWEKVTFLKNLPQEEHLLVLEEILSLLRMNVYRREFYDGGVEVKLVSIGEEP